MITARDQGGGVGRLAPIRVRKVDENAVGLHVRKVDEKRGRSTRSHVLLVNGNLGTAFKRIEYKDTQCMCKIIFRRRKHNLYVNNMNRYY